MTAERRREHLCRARDGTVLRGRVWECAHPEGLVVIRTPYDADRHASTARSWNARGYHCLVQDVRGRYRSAGVWSPYTYEEDDGGPVLAQLAAEHPGLPLVLFGASYAAHTALEAARAAARDGTLPVAAIVVLVPALGSAETAWDTTGVPQIRHRIGWWHQHGRLRHSRPPLSVVELSRRTAQAREHGVVEAAEKWGWEPSALTGWRRLWSAERVDLPSRYGHIDVPLLVISGDDDFFHDDARRLARTWNASSHFVSGPWGHGLVGGVTDDTLRSRVTAAGGLTRVIDPWLSAQGLPGAPAAWTEVLASTAGPRSRSVLDPVSGAWKHSRTNEDPTLTLHDTGQRHQRAAETDVVTRPTDRPMSVESLVDPECGIIRSVRAVPHPTGAPTSYMGLTAAVSDARQLGEWPADRVSLGTSFDDAEQARIAAIAEGVERYCGNWLPADLPDGELRIGSRAELSAAGARPIDLSDLPVFAPWQYDRDGFPYERLTEDTPTLWTRCGDRDGAEVWMPASLIHLNWRQSRFRHLPRVHHLNYAGIATGQGTDDARDRGVLEVVERDALELWWHLDGPTFGIDPASVPGLVDHLRGSSLNVSLVAMPSEFAPAVAALVHDEERGLYAAGFSASLDPVRAARKAVLEAVHTWVYTQGCATADGWVFRAVEHGLMARGLYLDFRGDATYLDAAGAQCEHIVDLGAHVQLWLDPRVHEEARRFTAPALGTRPITAIPAVSMDEVHQRLADRGHRVITRDLTTTDVRRTPLRVVRTFITGLVPNAPAAFAYLGMPRFGDAALERRWRTSWDGSPADVTLIPPPHM